MDAKFCAANKRSASLAGSEAAVYVKSSQASFLQTSFWRAVSSVSGLANELGVYKLQAEARHQTVLETGPVFALASVHARSWRVQPRPRCVCSLQCSYCATLVWTVAANKWLVHNQPASKGSARVAHASSQRPQRGHAPPSAKAPPAGQLSKFHLTSFSPTDQTCAKQMAQQRLLLAALLLASALAASAAPAARCGPGLIGAGCNTCVTDAACVTMTKVDTAWCFNTTVFMPETKKKSFACTTDGTPFQKSITRVWVDCAVEVNKCDFHFAMSGYPITCSALSCQFKDSSVSCQGASMCDCDETCPTVDGVSLGFLLRDLKAKAAFECEESWAGPTLCTLDIPGLTPDGGFQSYCAAAECRLH